MFFKRTQCDTTETAIEPFDSYGTPMNPFKCVNFTEYPCHYCQKIILSKDDLEKHKPVCYTIEDFAPYPCSICGAQCPEEDDLGRHRTTYHGLGTMNKEVGLIFWCDVCPLTFSSKSELDDHVGVCHAEEFQQFY